MATISNTLKTYAPTLMRGASKVFPAASAPLKAGAAYIESKNKQPSKGLVTPPQAASTSPAPVTTPVQQTSFSNNTQGLLKPGVASLNPSLAQNKPLVSTQPPSFSGLVGEIQSASKPSQTQTGLVNRITNAAEGFAPIANEAKRISDQYAQEIARVGNLGAGAAAGALSTGTDVVGSGNAAIASQSASQRMSALSDAQQAALRGTEQQLNAQGQTAGTLGNALTGATSLQSQQLSGLGSAAGFAQPQLAQVGSQQYYSPLGGVEGGGAFNPQTTASQYAQDVISGARTYNDAVAAMELYGPAGKQYLDSVIRQQRPDFNFAQAQTLSGIQGTVAPDVQFAKDALLALQASLANLKAGQATGFKPVREAANFLSGVTGYGSQATATTAGLVADARTALQRALASASGGTPTDYGQRALQMLPDQPSEQQVAAALQVIEELGAIRQDIYGTPGTSGGGGGGVGWY